MPSQPVPLIVVMLSVLGSIVLCGCGKPPAALQSWRLLEPPLLAHWQSADVEGGGAVDLQPHELSLGMGKPMTCVRFTGWETLHLPVTDYAVEFEAMRMEGQDFFGAVTFPVRSLDTCATLVTGGWGGGLVGISSIDEQNANENSTRGEHQFVNGQWYRFRLEVRSEELKAWLDGRLVINTSIKARTISLRPGDIEKCAPFGVATYLTEGKVRNLSVQELK